MSEEIQYSEVLPLNFKTWHDFFLALHNAGQAEHETIHFLRRVHTAGLAPVSDPYVMEEYHYQMEFIRAKALEELNAQQSQETS